MIVHTLSNLSSTLTKPADFATLVANATPLPPSIKTKKDLITWRESPHTQHVFYSPYEGVSAHVRVSAKDDNNPAWKLHGVVIDYDQQISGMAPTVAAVQANQSPDYPVAWVGRTYSGGAHLVWEFEKPINIINKAMLEKFLAVFVASAKCRKLLGGFDDMSLKPSLYYTLYNDWTQLSGVVSDNLLQNILYQVGKSIKPYESEGPSLPWGVIADNMAKLFPGQWVGKVEEGARGKRFWDPSASHANAAMLTSTGVVYFTDGGGFIPWGSPTLFGPSVVAQHQATAIANAVADIYYDGNRFYRKVNGNFLPDPKEIIQLHLKVAGGLSSITPRNQLYSEIDEALQHITTNQRVVAAHHFPHNHNPIVRFPEGPCVNLSSIRCHPMDEHPVEWGQGFPFIANWLDKFFPCKFSKELWLSWLHWFYSTSYDGNPKKGQALFIAGEGDVGKTLMSHRLISPMVGGHAEIANYLLGKDQFNSKMFRFALGTVDDNEAVADVRTHLRYTSAVKRLIANQKISIRQMYAEAIDVPYLGRIVVTMNRDPESMTMIPAVDMSNQDKMIILRTSDKTVDFPLNVEQIIASELSSFCRYVYDWQIPKNCTGTARYHVRSWIDPILVPDVEFVSQDYAMTELIGAWRESYFTANPSAPDWHGNVTALVRELEQEFTNEHRVLRDVSLSSVSRRLRSMVSKYPWIKQNTRRGVRGFSIDNPFMESETDFLEA
jgi:hypothetical protein